jgi:hypothetical protein
MNKFFKGGIVCGLVAVLLVMTVVACSGKKDGDSASSNRIQYNPESDFRAEPTDGGKGVEITGYYGGKWEVNIPPKIQGLPVTEIGGRVRESLRIDGAFQDKKLVRVTIPSSVTDIWDNAFADNQLTSVTIPNSVTYIGRDAFSRNQLTSVTIGARVTLSDEIIYNHDTSTRILNKSGFTDFYNNNGEAAGTYTRPDAESSVWTKK